jgi:hypothetical protein
VAHVSSVKRAAVYVYGNQCTRYDRLFCASADMLNHSEENNCCFRPNIPLAQYVPSSDMFEVGKASLLRPGCILASLGN